MRTRFTIFLMVLLLLCQAAMPALAMEEPDTVVFVTIVDNTGTIVSPHNVVAVTDVDEDDKLTIYDALYCAHEQLYEGGAGAGYGTEETQWGTSLTKLWGIENGGSYGYYLNNASAMSLMDTVKNQDLIVAFAYTDTTTFSDTFSYFDQHMADVAIGDSVTLTLKAVGFDPNTFAPVENPVAGAKILIDGEDSGVVTDAEGRCTIPFTQEGFYNVSAISDTMTLVPPLCVVAIGDGVAEEPSDAPTEAPTQVPEELENKDFPWGITIGIILGAAVIVVAIVIIIKKKGAHA